MAQNRQTISVPAKERTSPRNLGSESLGLSSASRASQSWTRRSGTTNFNGQGMTRDPIRFKRQASELFARGAFGNYIQQWDSIEEVEDSGYEGLLVFRTRKAAGGGRTVYDLTIEEAAKQKFDPRVNYFNEQLNDQHKHVTMQGELWQGFRKG